MKKLHLGCGQIIHQGWDNLDLEPAQGGIRWDARSGLPYADNSVDYVISEHFIEHLTRQEGLNLCREVCRVLKPDGVFRVITPDLKQLATDYLNNFMSRWESTGWKPNTPCSLMNEGMRLWGHLFLYDRREISLLLRQAGFKYTIEANWRKSDHEALQNIDMRPFFADLIYEAIK